MAPSNDNDNANIDPETGLRTDGPTLTEYVAAGYLAENYPPQGYAARTATEPEVGAPLIDAPVATQVVAVDAGRVKAAAVLVREQAAHVHNLRTYLAEGKSVSKDNLDALHDRLHAIAQELESL